MRRALLRPIAPVHRERRTQAAMKMMASQAVNFFKTSAVEVPKTESPGSPPKDAPKPKLLLSWIRITSQRRPQSTRNKKRAI